MTMCYMSAFRCNCLLIYYNIFQALIYTNMRWWLPILCNDVSPILTSKRVKLFVYKLQQCKCYFCAVSWGRGHLTNVSCNHFNFSNAESFLTQILDTFKVYKHNTWQSLIIHLKMRLNVMFKQLSPNLDQP